MNSIDDFNKGDEADLAFADIYRSEQQALETVLASSRPENQPNYNEFDGKHCVDCGEEIIAARLIHKFIRCVDCQHKLEVRRKQYS